MLTTKTNLTLGLALAVAAGAVSAHVVLEQGTVPTGSSYRATLRVGHGCDGLPTTSVIVAVPAGLQGAKPMPKAGWRLSTRVAPLAQPYTSHGKRVEQDVVEIRWEAMSADAALPDAFYDEFVFRASVAAAPGVLWVPVTQLCRDGAKEGRLDWTQLPAEGARTAAGLKSPAAMLVVTEGAGLAPVGAASSASGASGAGEHRH